MKVVTNFQQIQQNWTDFTKCVIGIVSDREKENQNIDMNIKTPGTSVGPGG